MAQHVPQPSVERITNPSGQPLVVGVEPNTSDLVLHTAATWARALGSELYIGYADPTRETVQENPDGTVLHTEIDPDVPDDSWKKRETQLRESVKQALTGYEVIWHFRYLAGPAERSLTHLARIIDASAFIVGAKGKGVHRTAHDYLHTATAVQLAHHQHRPVITVPVSVVDWKEDLL